MNTINHNSFLLSIYINSFLLTSIFKIFNIRSYTLIFIFFLSIFINNYKKIKFNISFFISNIFIIIFLFNILFYLEYKEAFSYFKILVFLYIYIYFSQVKISLKKLNKYLLYTTYLSFILLVIFIKNKNLYNLLELSYMTFGYECLKVGLIFSYFYKESGYKKKRYLFLAFICNIIILLYGSRYSFLIGLLGLLFLWNKKLKNLYFLGLILFIFIFSKIEFILKIILEILIKYEISTFSVNRIYNSIINFNNNFGILGSRKMWFTETINLIKSNPIFGSGIMGHIKKIPCKYNNFDGLFYPHNIFLEITMQFGIIGIIIFFIIIFLVIKEIYQNKKKNYRISNLYFVFFILSLELLLSNSYLRHSWFWFSLLIPFNKTYYLIKRKNSKCCCYRYK